MLRHGVQFHWQNPGYADFDEFLATLNHDKRKKIKQERRRVRDAGISFEWFAGNAITDALWAFFNRCYRETYRQHHSTPYLNLDFFRAIGRTMPENLLLIVATRDHRPIAASLNIHNEQPAVRPLLGRRRISSCAAFRNLLLPGDRILHRARHRDIRRRRAGRTQDGARTAAGRNALRALACAPSIRRCDRGFSEARTARRVGLCR